MSAPWTIWLASYPKSGNTWVRAMLGALTSESEDPDFDINALVGGPMPSNRSHMERMLGFASSDLTDAEVEGLRPLIDAAFDRSLDEVRFRKVHDTLMTERETPIVPPEGTRGAIYLVRDPRDVAVSLAHQSGRATEWAVGELANPESAAVDNPSLLGHQARQRLGTWSEHVIGWTEHEHFPVLVVRYEDMAADPLGQLERLARFAGLEPTRKRLAATVRSASFESLRAKEERDGFVERLGRDRPFFRSGRAGGWREELAPELAARVERDHAEVMGRFGYSPKPLQTTTARTSSPRSPS